MQKLPVPPDNSFFYRTDVSGCRHLKVRPWRWLTAVLLAAAFLLSYFLDIQVLEGSMVASRLMGFHLADLYSGLEVIAAHGSIATNLALGMTFIGLAYWILGGRTFCAWACPYGLLSEWAELIHLNLVKKGWIRHRRLLTTRIKYVFTVSFLAASFLSG